MPELEFKASLILTSDAGKGVVGMLGLGFGSRDGFCGELELNKLFFLINIMDRVDSVGQSD